MDSLFGLKVKLEHFERTKGPEGASWRRVKLSRATVGITIRVTGFRSQYFNDGVNELDFSGESTLGDVFDVYCSLVEQYIKLTHQLE